MLSHSLAGLQLPVPVVTKKAKPSQAKLTRAAGLQRAGKGNAARWLVMTK